MSEPLRKELGKIQKVSFGYGGYQDAQFGLNVTLGGGSWGVSSFHGAWSLDITPDKNSKWSEADRDKHFAETMRYVNEILKAAKVTTVDQLLNVAVEVSFDGMMLKSWRVLTEVV